MTGLDLAARRRHIKKICETFLPPERHATKHFLNGLFTDHRV